MDRAFPGIRLFHATEHLLPKLTRRTASSPCMTSPTSCSRSITCRGTGLPADDDAPLPPTSRSDHRRLREHPPRRVAELPARSGKIEVIPEGVEPRFQPDIEREVVAEVRRRLGLPERFVLSVGTIEPRKNHETLVEAYASLRDRHPDVGLVIAGGRGWLYERFFERVRGLGLDGQVVFTGYVPDEDMPPAQCGRGVRLPLGVRGVRPASTRGDGVRDPRGLFGRREPARGGGRRGDGRAPSRRKAWVQAIDRLLGDPTLRAGFGARGLTRARRFSWGEAADRTLEVYRSVLASSRA